MKISKDVKAYCLNDKVKNCPQCNSRNIIANIYTYPYPSGTVKEWLLQCEDCGCELCEDKPTEQMAIEAWNSGDCI